MLPRLFGLTALAAVAVLAAASAAPAHHDPDEPVTARLETPPLWDEDDADADDPAIWVHPEDPERSLVIGTAKEAGMYVYDLDGVERQFLPPKAPPSEGDEGGRYNNVDLVYGFDLDGRTVDLAVASDRGLDRIGVWTVDPQTGVLTEVTDVGMEPIFNADQDRINEERTAYGLTTWTDRTGSYVLVSQASETRVALLRLTATGTGAVGYEPVRTIELPAEFGLPDGTSWTPCTDPGEGPQVEGMVVDAARNVAYLGQEEIGIWRVPADLTGEPRLIDRAVEFGLPGRFDEEADDCVHGDDPGFGGERLRTDIEGLTIYHRNGGKGYLLASSQGDDSFAVYATEGRNRYLGSFSVDDGDAADGAQHSDGAAVVNVGLGQFDQGLLVVQDGDNTPEGSDESSTNFKFIAWSDVVDGGTVKGLR
ncbi:phytase [Glycomyces halotolerans]